MTTYIPAVLTAASTKQVEAAAHSRRLTRAGLRVALSVNQRLEFISRSSFHRPGAHFTLDEAVEEYGAVGIEVRSPSGALIAMVMAAPGAMARVS